MVGEGIPKGWASMSKTTRGKSNVDTRLGEEIEGGKADAMAYTDVVKMICIEGQRCGVNCGQV